MWMDIYNGRQITKVCIGFSAYENGKAFPSVDILTKLCGIFYVSADFMLDRTDVRYTIKDFCDKNLSPDELELVTEYRQLSYPQKK